MKIKSILLHNFRSFPQVTANTKPIRLEDFSILVGKNNSGKSNILRATRYFYLKDDYKSGVSEEDFHFGKDGKSDELWVEITFGDFSDSEIEALKAKKYLLPENIMTVRRTAYRCDIDKKAKGTFLNGYVVEGDKIVLSQTKFHGWDSVGLSEVGDILHIPTVKSLPDELKGAQQSGALFAKLMKEIIEPAVLQMSAFAKLQDDIRDLEKELRRGTQEGEQAIIPNSLTEIEKELSEALADWDAVVNIKFSNIPASDIVSRVADVKVTEGSRAEISPDSMGHGPQRYLLFAMIRLWAKVERLREEAKKEQEDKKARLLLLLFEEPELYLDPYQTEKLSGYLSSLIQQGEVQILITTHSPYVVPSEHEDFKRIARLKKCSGISKVNQASLEFISAASSDEYKDEFRYALWLNADRKAAYFAEWVILAEGHEEKVALNYLAEQFCSNSPRPVVLDCGGKKQIPKFMELMKEMGIRHKVVADDDAQMSQGSPEKMDSDNWRKEIEGAKNEFTINDPIFVPETLPRYLMGQSIPKGACKPLELLKWLEQNSLGDEKKSLIMDVLSPPNSEG